jgi:hypothetical protein
MYMYICKYIYIYVYTYIYIYIYIYILKLKMFTLRCGIHTFFQAETYKNIHVRKRDKVNIY